MVRGALDGEVERDLQPLGQGGGDKPPELLDPA